MAWQLIYTSAEHGLAAGRSGFCIVAQHADIRERLVAELERLSVYDRPSTREPLPVIHAHRILTVGSDCYHILSCIQDASPDYSGRTNHIAHHLICEEHELNATASPALVLRRFPWRKRWDEPPRYFEDSERVVSCFHEPAPIGSSWKELTGDPAHARLLIEPAARTSCYVAYAQGDDYLLLLFDESLRLLHRGGDAPRALWQIPFTTFIQPTDSPRDFAWRGCRAGTSTHRSALATGETTFDLTQPTRLPTPAPVETPRVVTVSTVSQLPKVQVVGIPKKPSLRKPRWRKGEGRDDGLSETEPDGEFVDNDSPEVKKLRAKGRRRRIRQVFETMLVAIVVGASWLWLRPRLSKTPAVGGNSPSSADSQTQAIVRTQDLPATSAITETHQLTATNELDLQPKVPTRILFGHLATGIDLVSYLPTTLPEKCRAEFARPSFTSFPSCARSTELTIYPGETTWWREGTSNKLRQVKATLSRPENPDYRHVALCFTGQPPIQLILLDDTVKEPAFSLSVSELNFDANGRSVAVKSNLIAQLQNGLPAGVKFRIRSAQSTSEVSSLPLIDIGAIREPLEKQAKITVTDFVAAQTNLSNAVAILEGLRKQDPAVYLSNSFVKEFGSSDPINSVLTTAANVPYNSGNISNYFGRIRQLLRACTNNLELGSINAPRFSNWLNNQLTYTTDKWTQLPKDPLTPNAPINKFYKALTNCYSELVGNIGQAQNTVFKYVLDQTSKSNAWVKAQQQLSQSPQRLESGQPFWVDLQSGTNWWPLIEFKDSL